MAWYLMKAHHMSNRNHAIKTIIAQHFGKDDGTIFAIKTQGGRTMFACSSGIDKTNVVGTRTNWINDTGMGHREPPMDHCVIIVENVIHVKNGAVAASVNKTGLADRRSTWVFK